MNRHFFTAAFALGLGALLWVGAGFVGTSPLALLMTVVLAGVYAVGAWELVRFRATTVALGRALAQLSPQPDTPDRFHTWLAGVPPALQHTVRQRIEGERTGLPGPALTPYLVGLLVMLGMVGTFLGLIVTFKGTVLALEGSADLQAVRTALAAPIKGLGLAFGTSVAGVAASAMLGLMSALARRERVEVGRALDAAVATVFRPFSLVHQRQETFKALQAQTQAMPRVVDSLQTLAEGLERRHQQLNTQLLDQQAQFHRDAAQAYTGLAERVGQALHTSLAASAQTAGDTLQRTVQAAMAEMVQASAQAHQRQMDATHTQLAHVATQFGATAQAVSSAWEGAQQSQAHTLAAFTHTFEQRSSALLATLAERDNLALAERTQLLGQFDTLLHGMEQAHTRFTDALDAQADHTARAAAHVGASAVDLASVGEAFGHGMALFNTTHEKLTEGLARLEATLEQSMARSDEQLAYCVAQAREVIDLSIAAQQGIVEDLRRFKAEARAA